MRRFFSGLFLICVVLPLQAEELSFLYGDTTNVDTQHSSYAWKIDYRQNFLRYGAWSASWMNEGHVDGHRRDGAATQLWITLPFFNGRTSVALGGGVYRYFDTVSALTGRGTVDDHGFAQIYSVSGTYDTRSPVFLRITLDQIVAGGDIHTQTIQAGIGYRLWKTWPEKKDEASAKTTTNEITLAAGESVINSFNDRHQVASGVEFRKGFAAYGDWSLSWINEGSVTSISRNGFGGEVWLVDNYFNRHLTFGIGTGPFFLLDPEQQPETKENSLRDVTGIVTLTTAWRWNAHWLTRFSWDRVIRSATHDADVFLLGMGYRWGH